MGRKKVSNREITNNQLMRLVVESRIDAAVKNLLERERTGSLPAIGDEKATGSLDKGGSIFLPGGWIHEGSDHAPIDRTRSGPHTVDSFRSTVRKMMGEDLATLVYPDGFALQVDLPNEFLGQAAVQIGQKLVHRRKTRPRRGSKVPHRVTVHEIAVSYSVIPGERQDSGPRVPSKRAKVTASLAACMTRPLEYFDLIRDEYRLQGQRLDDCWDDFARSLYPISSPGIKVLMQPHQIVCHCNRLTEDNLVGLTKITYNGNFGEFATLTLEEATETLLDDAKLTSAPDNSIFFSYGATNVMVVLRRHPATQPGRRVPHISTSLILPRDFGYSEGDIEKIVQNAFAAYNPAKL